MPADAAWEDELPASQSAASVVAHVEGCPGSADRYGRRWGASGAAAAGCRKKKSGT